MKILILDTEQTYGDIGYVVLEGTQTLVEGQLVISTLFNQAPNNKGKEKKNTSYKKLKNCFFGNTEEVLNKLNEVICTYTPEILCTHNLSADRKVFNSWCLPIPLDPLNPFKNIKTQVDSELLVKFLTTDEKQYSLESFVRNLGINNFVQEHTGLADALLIRDILKVFTEQEFQFWFIDKRISLLKKYYAQEKTLMHLLSGGCTSGQLGYDLHSSGYAYYSEEFGQRRKFFLSKQGRSFFSQDCKEFYNRRAEFREEIKHNLLKTSGQKILEDETDKDHEELKNLTDQIIEAYQKEVNEYRKSIEQKLADTQEQCDKMMKDTIAQVEELKANAEKDAQEAKDTAAKEAQEIVSEARIHADAKLAEVDLKVWREFECRTTEAAEYTAKAKMLEEKAKHLYWGGWFDRIFWILLGAVVGCIVFWVSKITF